MASFGSHYTKSGAGLTLRDILGKQKGLHEERRYFDQLEARTNPQIAGMRVGSRVTSFPSLKAHTAEAVASTEGHGAKIPERRYVNQELATLLREMNDYERRKGYGVGVPIGDIIMKHIAEEKYATMENAEAVQQALLAATANNLTAHDLLGGIPANVSHEARMEYIRERMEREQSGEFSAERTMNYVLSDDYLKKLNRMDEGASVRIGEDHFQKEKVIEALNAIRNNPELQTMGPQAQMLALVVKLRASKVELKHGPKDPDAATKSVTELPKDTRQELRNNKADINKVAEQINHNFCRTADDYKACRAETKDTLSPENISKTIKGLEALDAATAASTPAPPTDPAKTQPDAAKVQAPAKLATPSGP